MKLKLAAPLLGLILMVGCTSGSADVVLEIDQSPLDNAQLANIEGALENPRDLEFLGRVIGPQGESFLVTYGQGQYDECYAVFEGSGYSTGCGSLEPPIGGVVVGQTGDNHYTGLVVDTSTDGITAVRVAVNGGQTYEVAPLGALSYITFEAAEAGFILSLIAGDEVIYQNG
ncbi:MAG: hypothetical protein WBM90_04145 [Acidimicrobiia bacterium]